MPTNDLEICLIEDDPFMGESLSERLRFEGYRVAWHERAAPAIAAIQEHRYDAIISDIVLPDISGIELYTKMRCEHDDLPPTIFITGYGNIEHAVELLKLGAADYLTKPLDINRLIRRLREVLSEAHKDTGKGESSAPRLGVSAQMRQLEGIAANLARHPGTPVLIVGESGVGKEALARHLHMLPETHGPFIAVNCASIPESLMEAELFGFERGAFTGAERQRRGYFEQAEGGTLFLDEIGDMPPNMQVKVLRTLQERTITRVGGERAITINARFIFATHQNLETLIAEGRFREDLYYRINVVKLEIPPLYRRKEDILWLAERFLAAHNEMRPKEAKSLDDSARFALLDYDWPGNVRELKHIIERACILTQGRSIRAEDLFPDVPHATDNMDDSLKDYLGSCERERILTILGTNQWQIGKTAQALAISRKALWEKMRKFGLQKRSITEE